ncbi:MAG TPA: restriction endonuclease subunit S [Nitrosomonas nitrosa]|nr:restriction endonuclease subunit S [Nitrosomonas nitrosa]
MELKSGYKQTEVGVIPEDWSVVRLSVLISELNAGVSVNSVDEKLGLYGHTESVLKTSCILDGYFFPEECKKILPGDIGRAKLNPTKDSIVISRMNTPVLVGECGYVDKDYSYLFLPDRLWQTIIRKEAGVNVRWLAYLLSFGQFSKAIKDTATGTSGSMKNISKETFLGLQVVFPDKREQTAIANALSDVDALIQSLTRLIAKKRQIKQGAMQTLLNPYENGRLKAGWVVKSLGRVAEFINGRAYSLSEWENYGTPVIRLQNLTGRGDEFYYSNLKLPEKQYCVAGDLLFMWSATFGPVIWQGEKAIYHYHIWKIECKPKEIDKMYLYFILDELTERLKRSSSNGGTMLHVTKEKMESIEIHFPPVEEQTRIATILSDMDAEIAALETKLAKYQHIKQGMMQNLLTGRIRLI